VRVNRAYPEDRRGCGPYQGVSERYACVYARAACRCLPPLTGVRNEPGNAIGAVLSRRPEPNRRTMMIVTIVACEVHE